MRHRLLIVEDNTDLRESLAEYFDGAGYHVSSYDSAESAEPHIDGSFAAGIIDINLPGKSGFSLIQSIRNDELSFPLVALTARDAVDDKLRGFELGLTDYVVKPFSLAELAARLKAHIRDTSGTSLSTSHITLIPDRREATVDGTAVTLTGTEYRLLEKLVQHNRSMVSIDDLIEHAWGAADLAHDPPVRIHMRNLRKKIDNDRLHIIKTVSGIGYMMDD